MPPDVSEISSAIAYRIRMIHRETLLKKMVDSISKKEQTRYKKDFDKHVWFEPCFAADDYVFIKRPLLMAFVAEHMSFARYPRLLTSSTAPYCVISIGPEYAKD